MVVRMEDYEMESSHLFPGTSKGSQAVAKMLAEQDTWEED